MTATNNARTAKPTHNKTTGTFCAPSCGRGCTKKEHDEATHRAKALATTLGDNWKPRVWENMGWHYEAILEGTDVRMTAHHNKQKTIYMIWINTETYSQNTMIQIIESGKDPRKLVRCANKELAAIAGRLQHLSNQINSETVFAR